MSVGAATAESRISHRELTARAVRWLRNTRGCNVAWAEVANNTPEIPDAMGWTRRDHGAGAATISILVECKTSRADFFRDQQKLIRHFAEDSGIGDERWYLTLPGVVRSAEEIPTGWGWAELRKDRVRIMQQPTRRTATIDWRKECEIVTLLWRLARYEGRSAENANAN